MSTEQTLADVLHDRADAASYDATPMSVVTGRARGIRRRRRLVAATAMAAVAAAVVPLAVLLPGDDGGRGVAPVDAPDAPPRIGYAVDGVYHRADRSTIGLPDGEVTTVTEHEGGVIVSDDPGVDGPLRLTSVAGSGEVRDTWCATSVPVTDGTAVAWTEVSCDGGPATIVVDRPDAEPQSWSVPGEPVLAGVRPGGGVVYVDAADGGAPYLSDREGFRVRVPGLLTATTYSPSVDLIAGPTPDGAAIVTTTGDVVRLLAGRRVVSFSPDGARVLTAVDEPGVLAAGAGWPADVLDTRSGATLTHVPESEVTYGSGRWEDAVSLLVVTDDEGVGRLARVTSDGVVSLLAEPATATETIVLQTMP